MHVAPGVEQAIAWPTIKASNCAGYGQVGQVGDAAYIDDDAMDACVFEGGGMKSRNQWCALSTCGNVSTAEIGNNHGVSFFC